MGGNSFRMRKKINKSIKPNVHIVTDMVKHLKIDVIEDILPLFNIIEVRQVNDKIEIDVISEQSPIHWEMYQILLEQPYLCIMPLKFSIRT